MCVLAIPAAGWGVSCRCGVLGAPCAHTPASPPRLVRGVRPVGPAPQPLASRTRLRPGGCLRLSSSGPLPSRVRLWPGGGPLGGSPRGADLAGGCPRRAFPLARLGGRVDLLSARLGALSRLPWPSVGPPAPDFCGHPRALTPAGRCGANGRVGDIRRGAAGVGSCPAGRCGVPPDGPARSFGGEIAGQEAVLEVGEESWGKGGMTWDREGKRNVPPREWSHPHGGRHAPPLVAAAPLFLGGGTSCGPGHTDPAARCRRGAIA